MKKHIIFFIILFAINILGAFFYFRLDLTQEKRYSLSSSSVSLLKNLDQPVSIKVYLDGNDLPNGFERLKSNVSETLEAFKRHSNANVNFQFVDPLVASDTLPKYLEAMGMAPTNLVNAKGGKRTETTLYPWAEMRSGGFTLPILLLKGTQGLSAEQKLNQSAESLEYDLASGIRKLTNKDKKKIGLLTDFTSLDPMRFAGMITALQQNYNLYTIESKKLASFTDLNALIVPKPDKPIDDSTKYKIDQFIMNGGRVLFFVDGLKIDQVGLEGSYAQSLDLGLDDLFFKYGFRLNKNLVKDGQNAAMIPMNVGQEGNKANVQLVPYRFYPLINNFGKSLITNNIDLVYSKFASSIDTIKTSGTVKTPLLKTSQYTRILNAPALVTYNEARQDTDPALYTSGEQNIGLLIEGSFNSLYSNRIFDADTRFKNHKNNGKSKLIVVSDGDIIVNDLDRRNGQPLPLGYDGASGHIFGNQDFIMNALDYLIDENGVIAARSKSIKLRPLDKVKLVPNRLLYQFLNVLLPILLIGSISLGLYYYKRKTYISI